MKKRFIACILIFAVGLCGCENETAEAIATTATTAAVSVLSTAAETTTPKTTKATTEFTTETEASKTEKQPEQREFIIDGSTSTIPLHAYIISKQSGQNYGNVRYYTEHSKTFEAFDKLIAGEADVILTVPITPEQRELAENTEGFTLGETAIALEGFVFIVNPENPVKSLTQAQIRDIYSGKITNWKEVGGDDAEIIAYQRNETSGSQSYMNEFMGETPLSTAPKTMIINEMGEMMQTVADYTNGKYALGYSVYSYAAGEQVSAGNVALVAVDGIKPDRESFTAGNYPLLSHTMLYYNESNERAINFRDMLISDEGQLMVLEAGYLPVREIEIPDIYAVYNELGTGKEKPADKVRPTEYSYYQGGYYDDYIDFLADKEFEATVNEWIKSNMSDKNGYCNQEIYNGYLSVETGYRAAVWDLYTGKKIEKFNELFYKDISMYPIVDAATLIAADSDVSGWSFLRCDYFGFLGKTENFSAAFFTLPNENAYFTTSIKVPLLLCLEENSIVSEYRDSQRFLVDGEKQEIIKIPPYDRADFEIEVDGRRHYYYQIKSDIMPPDEVTRINNGLIKACDYWRENLDYRTFSGRNELSFDWDFELTEDGIRFYVQDGEMTFDLDGNFITTIAVNNPVSYNDWGNIDRNTTKLSISCTSQYDIDMLSEFNNLENLLIIFGYSFDEDHEIPAPKTIDLTPINDKTGLQELHIVSCPKTDDFSWLKNFENLTDLMITGTFENYGVFDMKSISSLKHLENLNLQEHYIKNFEEISNLKSLKSFRFDPIEDTDITPIGELSNLTELKLWDYHGYIKDYTAISKLTELTTLGLQSLSDETDFSFLLALENLTEIEFEWSDITNCKFIESVKNKDKITTLILHYNKIESIENIELLTNLEGVNLSNNKIKNIREISNLKYLTSIILSDNEIEDFSPIFVTNTIETCGWGKRISIDNNNLNWVEIVDLVSDYDYVQLMG